MRSTATSGFDLSALKNVFDDSPTGVRAKMLAIAAVLLAANAGIWLVAWIAFHDRGPLLATALLAYAFGLRHAVDADHIAAIDNATRKLMQENKRPVAVGFFFSLGHSTIVVALSVAIACAATSVTQRVPWLENVGGIVGTSVSALFLYAIATLNVIVLYRILRSLPALRRGDDPDLARLDETLAQRGLIGRITRPLTRLIRRSWQMYPLGVLFGLGFDTATEIGVLGIAAIQAGKGLPIVAILIFPLLFTAGMSLIDTADGVLMLGAYGWAFVSPLRRVRYNVTITLVSVIVAVGVGTIEALSLVEDRARLGGTFWDTVDRAGSMLGQLGYPIVGVFAACWIGAMLLPALRSWAGRRRYDVMLDRNDAPRTAAQDVGISAS
jgi:high-affinity nickel-transport protein